MLHSTVMSAIRFTLLFSLLLVSHVAADAAGEANRLMNLLKTAIELNNIHALSGFVSIGFTYDTCNGVLSYDQFVKDLTQLADPPQSISTNWSTRDAQLVNGVVQFVLHFNDQSPVAYADIQFEAKQNGNNVFMLTSGKSMACR